MQMFPRGMQGLGPALAEASPLLLAMAGSMQRGESIFADAPMGLAAMMQMRQRRAKAEEERLAKAQKDADLAALGGLFNPAGQTSGTFAPDPTNALGLDMGSNPGTRGKAVRHGDSIYDMGKSETSGAKYADAIAAVESGGRYDAIGPVTKKGNRAYGKYQVMDFNIPAWTRKHVGREMTPQEFLSDPEAQDAVFNGEFGSYVEKYGNPQDAASMWFSGRPMAQAGNSSDGYNTVPQYVQKFTKALGNQPSVSTRSTPQATLGMIGGVKPDGTPWQSLSANGMAHASNPNYQDYSQLFREYRHDRPDESWVQVGERDGKPVYASPDYARGEDGNYLSVSAQEAQRLAQERGSLIPTRDEYRNLYEQANRVTMPTSADMGAQPGQGTPEQYTALAMQRMQQAGLQPGAAVVHGKEFFSPYDVASRTDVATDAQPGLMTNLLSMTTPQQGVQVAQNTDTQLSPGMLQFTPSKPRAVPRASTRSAQPQKQTISPQRLLQVLQSPHVDPRVKQLVLDKYKAQNEAGQPLTGKDRYMNVGGVLYDISGETPVAVTEMQPDPTTLQENVQWLMSPEGGNYSREDAIAIAKGGVNITNNMGRNGIDYGNPGDGLVWQRDANGDVVLDQRGAPVAIPYQGGKVYREQQEAEASQGKRQNRKQTTANVVLDDISRIREIVSGDTEIPFFGTTTTGLTGGLLSNVDSTEAGSVRNMLDTVRSNIGFDKLQSMREESPTGGALGQVSNLENRLLQATFGALVQSQKKDHFLYNLARVEEIYDRIVNEGIPEEEAEIMLSKIGAGDDPLGIR